MVKWSHDCEVGLVCSPDHPRKKSPLPFLVGRSSAQPDADKMSGSGIKLGKRHEAERRESGLFLLSLGLPNVHQRPRLELPSVGEDLV